MKINNFFKKNKDEKEETNNGVSADEAKAIKINNCDNELIIQLTNEFNKIMVGSKHEEVLEDFYQATVKWREILKDVDKTIYYIILELVARYFVFLVRDKKEEILGILDKINLIYYEAIVYVLELEVGRIEFQNPIIRKGKKYYARLLIEKYLQKMKQDKLVRKRTQVS